jgi:virginiamycin A acetyltransferase
VWIGYGATIMPGVSIGDGAIIGTGALVTKDVAPYEMIGGNPAKLIRKRFDDETIDFLLQLQWWNWSIEQVREHVLPIMKGDKEILKGLLS